MAKIYVIDDDVNIVESISIVLESQGHEVGSQNDEKNAVQNVTQFGADLIILDVMFPEDESAGFTVARELKGNEQTAKIPLLIISAVNEKGSYVGTFSNNDRDDSWLPVDEFIEKPIEPKQLITKVNNWLEKK